MNFEPTVGISNESNNGFVDKFKGFFDKLTSKAYENLSMRNVTFIMLISIILIIILIYIYKSLREILWRNKILKYSNDIIVKEIFKRITLQLENIGVYFDSGDTYISYGNKVFKEEGIVIFDIVNILSKSQYSEYIPSDEEVNKSMEDYYKLRDIIKNRVGKVKALVI